MLAEELDAALELKSGKRFALQTFNRHTDEN
jgi:hypothetical protein